MREVHVSLVKQDDFASSQPGTDFAGALVVMVFGGVDDGKGGQKTLQVQTQMTLGRGFAAAMLSPVHTSSHQLDGGGVYRMNGALETVEQALALSASGKARVRSLSAQDRPEQLLSQGGVAMFVGMGEIVAGGRRSPSQRGERSRVQAQRVTDVVETDGVGELGIDQRHHVAPRRKRAGLLIHARVARQLAAPGTVGCSCRSDAERNTDAALASRLLVFSSRLVAENQAGANAFLHPAIGWL